MGNTSFELEDLFAIQQWNSDGGDNSRRLNRLRRNLHRAMDELTESQRYCVELYYFKGYKQVAIARELGVNKSSVSRLLMRARKKLERSLQYSL